MIAPTDGVDIDGRPRCKTEWPPPGSKVYVDQALGELSLRGRTPWDWQKIISGSILKSKEAVDHDGDKIIRKQNQELRNQIEQLQEALQQQKTHSEQLEATLQQFEQSEADYKERLSKLEHHQEQLEIEIQESSVLLKSQIALHEEEVLHLKTSRQSWEKSIKDSLALEHYVMERAIRQLIIEKEIRSREMANLKETIIRAHGDRDAWRKERNTFVTELRELWRQVDVLKAANEKLSNSSGRCDVCSVAQVETEVLSVVVNAPPTESSSTPSVFSARDLTKSSERLSAIPERTATDDETDLDMTPRSQLRISF